MAAPKAATKKKHSSKETLDCPFFPLLQGSIACWHRPTPNQLHLFRHQTPCTFVVTCQGPGESPEEVKKACEVVGLKWLWVRMTGANGALMGSATFQRPVIAGLATVREAVAAGEHVLVHCAAGIHRTGFFTYALLRICGFGSEEAMKKLDEIRHVTAAQGGAHRFALSEDLASRLLSTGFTIEPRTQVRRITIQMTPFEVARVNIDEETVDLQTPIAQVNEVLGETWLQKVEYFTGSIGQPKLARAADKYLCHLVSGLITEQAEIPDSAIVFIKAFLPKFAHLLFQ